MIDPRILWWDDELEWLWLTCIIDPDGVHYVTAVRFPHVAIREDLLTFRADTPTTWSTSRTPDVPWHGRRPVAQHSPALFARHLIEPLYAAGCTVWPLEPHPDGTRTAVHAVLRGEDYIGWIMPSNRTEPNDSFAALPAVPGVLL